MTRHHFSKAATSYDAACTVQKHAAAWVMRYAEQAMLPFLAPADLVIDAGCGTGALGRMMSIPAFTLGIDHAEAMCHAAIPYYDACICADITATPLSEETMAGVVSSLCWQWGDPHAIITELARLLRPHGRAVITSLTMGSLGELEQSYAAMGLPSRLLPFATKETLATLMQEAGLAIRVMEEVTYAPIHPSCWDFFTHLKKIGAHQANGNAALSRATLGALMRYYDTHFQCHTGGVNVTYVYTGFVIEKREKSIYS